MLFHGKNLKIIRRVAKRDTRVRISQHSGKFVMRSADSSFSSRPRRDDTRPAADPDPLILGAFAPECKPDGFDRRMQALIEPDDSADLPQLTTALNVATPGTVRVTMADGSVAELSVNRGEAFPVQVRRVWQTGTTATGICGLA